MNLKNLARIILIAFVFTDIGCNTPGTIENIIIESDKTIFNPLLYPEETGKLSVTAIYTNGKKEKLASENIEYHAKTKVASGNANVVELISDRIIPKEGGVATIKAIIIKDGQTYKDEIDVIVRPFYRDYHQTLVLKLFMGMEGEPVERLVNEPLFKRPHDVIFTFKEALEVIRKTDNLTRGIPKIIYLVGWQKGGHDHHYPAWDEVNPRLKREEDSTALESLRWLIREAKRYNTSVSLHINMLDAYKHSPLWKEYVEKDLFAKDEQGKLLTENIQIKGDPMYHVVYPREWESGLAQRRIDNLIEMIPELAETRTIHVDVFIAQREDGSPLSPWHAKRENGRLTVSRYVDAQRKIFKYWREKGFDVTGEGILWAHPPGEGFYGLQPMAWWYPDDARHQMMVPENLTARGRTSREGPGDYRFTSSMQGEEIYLKDKENLPGFLEMFCKTTLPWYYLSQYQRVAFENEVLYYSGGIKAGEENGKKIIRKGNYILRENDNLFVEAKWKEKEIIAYSTIGYKDEKWQLPEGWNDVKSVDIYLITLNGPEILYKEIEIKDNELSLTLDKGSGVAIVPTGTLI